MLSRLQVKPEWGLADNAQLFGLKPSDGEIGVEFEVNGTNLKAIAADFNATALGKSNIWSAHRDGSLGPAGMEFVLNGPMKRNLAFEAIEELYYTLNTKTSLDLNRQCSTHVHFNFAEMSTSQTFLYLTLKYTLEEALFKAIAPERFYNNYCIPFVLSEKIPEELTSVLLKQQWSPITAPYTCRYKATNYNALAKHGSIENRMKGGTKTAAEAVAWIEVLLELYDMAKQNEKLTPEVFLDQFSGKGFQLYVQEFLPKTWALIKDIPNLSEIPNRGVWAAQDIAYLLDWTPCLTGVKPKKIRAADKVMPNFTTQAHTVTFTSTIGSTMADAGFF